MLDSLKYLIPSKAMVFAIIAILVGLNYYENQATLIPSPIVEISTGNIQGFLSKSRDGKDFYQFLGIPYAKDPTGKLRFEIPEPPEAWDGVRSATKYGSECIQVNPIFNTITGEEDCLFLNVFSPKVGSDFSKTPLPVMVYLHGGYFLSGSGSLYPGNYFLDEYIVLVTINYRLGSLGFLNTGDGVVRGNMGLKDQNKALKWVQANIQKFGGDAQKITLFGESAGAQSVNFHMASPLSKGLFHKAISQSGTFFKVWATQVGPSKQARNLIDRLNCTRETSEESVRCLKGLKPEILVETHKDASTPYANALYSYAPSIETVKDTNSFLTEDPKNLISSGRGHNVPWIIGANSGEGLLFTSRVMYNKEYRNELENNFETLLPRIFVYDKNRDYITKRIREFYLNAGSDDKVNILEKFENYTNMFSDRFYNSPTKKAAIVQAKFSPAVYTYYNDYSTQFTLFDFLALERRFPAIVEILWKIGKKWFQRTILGSNPPSAGVFHADELSLFFPFPMAGVHHTHQDFAMSRSLIKLWVQFAYDDTKMEFNGVPWTPVSPNSPSPKYMLFSNDVTKNGMIDEPFRERMEFWESLKLPN